MKRALAAAARSNAAAAAAAAASSAASSAPAPAPKKQAGQIRPRSADSSASAAPAAPALKSALKKPLQTPPQQQQATAQQNPQSAPASKAAAQQRHQKKQTAASATPVAAPAKASTTVAAAPKAPALAPSHSWCQLAAGTYHSAVQGFTFRFSRDEALTQLDGAVKPPQLRFTGTQHTGCVHAVAGNGSNLLASAGADERIALYSVRNNGTAALDMGTMQPAATVRCMSFVQSGGGHLICGCEDGSLAVYRTRTWQSEAVLRVHDKAILSFVTTPNGALAVTLSQDRFLAFVDLMRGTVLFRHKFGAAIAANKRPQQQQQAATAKEGEAVVVAAPHDDAAARFGFVHQPPRQVVLSPAGSLIAVVAPFYVAFFDLRSATLLGTLHVEDPQPAKELQAGAFVRSSAGAATANNDAFTLVLATEAGDFAAIDVPQGEGGDTAVATSAEAFAAQLRWTPRVVLKEQPRSAALPSLLAAGTLTTNIASNRIRSVIPLDAGCNGIATASSAGEVRCWVASATRGVELRLVECCQPAHLGGRVTCMFASLI